MKAALTANGDGVPVVWTAPIRADNSGDRKGLLARPPYDCTAAVNRGGRLMLQREVPLDEQDGV